MAWVLVGKERREEDESEREDRKEEMAWILVGRGGGRKMNVREKTGRKRWWVY
jgi:hypothetical protein